MQNVSFRAPGVNHTGDNNMDRHTCNTNTNNNINKGACMSTHTNTHTNNSTNKGVDMSKTTYPNWPIVDEQHPGWTPVVRVYIPSEGHTPNECGQDCTCDVCGTRLTCNRKKYYCPMCGNECYGT